jgi:bifunctional DNA-binding transcriptional regulator/antitoxin component of YhaV-PrlF toxin-antitoxin module
VIPHEIRERLGIKPNMELAWTTRDGVIVAVPIPEDPVRGLLGVLKGKGPSTKDLLAERKRDLELEREKLKQWLNED